jgi:hypothetical protein
MERTQMYAVWIDGVDTSRDDGWLSFPTDENGVRFLMDQWVELEGEPVTIEERGGFMEGYLADRTRVMIADPDTDRLATIYEDPKPGGAVGTFPMGITGLYMRRAVAAGQHFGLGQHPDTGWQADSE